ncbi:MAG: GNAT family N-acetyltransferase [Chloroflexota bacterium]|nr:GNAT family N-acetyltransferase [Chloroflexota bacterium]
MPPRTAEPPNVHVRAAVADDADDARFLAELAPRLAAGAPDWHTPADITAGTRRHFDEALQGQRETEVMLIAEETAGSRLGFLYAVSTTDFFTGEPHGHISDIVVAPAAEGRGVAMLLLHAAEAWARERGFRTFTLHVFPANTRAERLYARLGYELDVLRLRKSL